MSLVEIVLAVVLSTLVGGVLVAALSTSMTAADRTTASIASSVDEQLITAFLARDAQAAGGIDPLTTNVLGSLGVSTDDDVAGWAGCVQNADLAVRFAWVDRTALASSQVVVTYALHPDGRFVRRACEAGTSTESVLASNVTGVDVACEPVGCAGIPDAVVLTVRGGPPASPFEVTVRASLRPELQTAPDLSNAAQVPLVVTGTSSCPVLSQTATGGVHVLGGLVVADDCGLTPVVGDLSSLVVSGTTALLGGLSDPLAGLAPPATCPSGPAAAAPAVGSSAGPDAVTVHTAAVTITSSVTFQPGRHVFCGGLTIGSGAAVTGSGVLVFVPRGALTISSGATVSLSPATSGPYAGLGVWSAGTDEVAITSGATVHDLRGTVYVPDAPVRLASTSGIRLGALVADRVTLTGTGPIRFGQPSPTLTVAGTQLPDATNLQPYSATAPSVSGGTAPLRYRATGLPTGLVVSTGGAITGTPLTAGTSTVSFLVVDATGASVVFTRTLAATDAVPVLSQVIAQGGDGTATVSWDVSSGSSIVSSTVTATATGQPTRTCTTTGTSRTCTLTDLVNGVTYAVSVTATSTQGTSAPATTSVTARPAALTGTGSQLWLDATDPDGDGATEGTGEQCGTGAPCATNANVLIRWEDKSGSNNDALQTTASMRPRFVPALPAVDFDANGFLQATVSSGPDLTVFVVAQSDTTTWNTWGWLLASRRPNGIIIHPWPGGRNVGWYPTNAAGGFLTPMETIPATIVDPRIYELSQTGSNPIVSAAGLDGNRFGAATYTGQTRTATSVTLLLGADDIAGRNGNGKYREVIVFSRTLTAPERRAIVEYLGRKWGIAVTPSAPTGVTASPGNASVTVAWTAPSWNGGSAVTSTRVTASPGGASCTATAPATTCTVTGLTNGTAYTFTAAAVNAPGTGEPSAPSNTATPGPPLAPTAVLANPGSRQAVVSWTAPATNGHAPVTSSTVTATAFGQTTRTCTATAPATTCTVTGLTNGVTYTVSVTTTNAHGTGPAAATVAVTPTWTPTALGSALTWWFDANDPAALTGAWTTRSGLTVTGTAGSNRIRVSTGVVERIDVIAGGSNYATTPTITVSGGGGTGAAVGEITLTAGALTSVEARVRGSGYTSEPTVTVSGGGGSGAVLRARIVAEVTVGSTIRIAGQTYTVTDRDGLVLTVSPPLAAAATAATFDEFRISQWANRAVPGVHDARQATTTNQPVLGTMSGRPAVVFSGLGSWLSVLDPNGTQTFDHHPNWTVLVAYQSDRQLAAGAVAQPWNATNARVFTSSGSGRVDWESAENVQVQTDIGTDSVTGGPVRVGTDAGNGSDTYHWNRVLIGEMSHPTLLDGWGLTGRVGEIIFVNAPMDSQAVADATGYLTAKWTQPAVVPSAPINVTLTPGDASATVSWRPSAGYLSAISFYQAIATAPGQTTRTCLSFGTSCTLTNLTNGAVYTVTVNGNNSSGVGLTSVPVTVVTRPALLTGTNARVWFDAADVDGDGWIEGGAVETGAGGGRVATWADKSGRSNHASAPSTATRPIVTSQTMNDLPVITFDGTTILQGAAATNPYGITGDRTLFVVTRRRSGAPSRLIDRNPEDNPLFNITWDNRLEVRADNGGQYQSGIGPSSSVAGTTYVLSAHRSGTSLDIWTNGTLSGTSTITGNQTQRALAVGRHVAWAQASDHDVAEVILFDRALSATERRQVEEYLRLKWGAAIIPGTPTSVTATRSNGAVTVSWTAPSDGGSPITSSTITASNGATCTTATTSCTFSGLDAGSYTFTVRATNAIGTGVTSNASNAVSWSIARTATVSTARPWDGVLHADHVWVTNQGSGTISKISVATNQVVATVAVGSEPRGIATDGTFLWVTNHGSDTLSKVDPVGNRVVATVAVDRDPWGVAFDGRFVWVANHGSDRVSKVDPTTNTVVATVSVRQPIDVTAAFGSVWVTSDQAWRVMRINPSTNTVITEIDAGQGPRGIMSDGTSIWVTNYERDTVTRVDPSTNQATATVRVGDGAVDLASAGGRLWVTVESTDAIVPVDPAAATAGAPVATGADPLGIVADPTTATLWTMNSGADSVWRFSV